MSIRSRMFFQPGRIQLGYESFEPAPRAIDMLGMAFTDLVVTVGSVLGGSGAVTGSGTAAVTITAGQVLYLDTTLNTYKLADNDSATASVVAGIALHGTLAGQPIKFITSGDNFVPGATLTLGEPYFLGEDGGIMPYADIGSGEYVIPLGVASSTTVLKLGINNTGIVHV